MTCTILHVSDTHLGNRQYSSDLRRLDFARAFQQAVDIAVDREVDAVVHTGDLFDSRDPGLPDLNDCIDVLRDLETAEIPFYAIVGNHERKRDDQFLDLLDRVGVAERLNTIPKLVDDEVALYGIDAVTKPAWHAQSFDLQSPPDDVVSVLCLHQLLHPPAPEHFADHPLDDVLERATIDLDAVALGDYHEAEGDVVGDTTVWYAGSTERCAVDETSPRTISLLEIEGRSLTRKRLELDTRPFVEIEIEFAESDGHGYAEDVIERHDVGDAVVTVTLAGDESTVTASQVRELVVGHGAAICRVDDQRAGPEFDLGGGPSGDVKSVERLVEEELAAQELSAIALDLEERVRVDDPPLNGFDDQAEQLVERAQAEAFDEETSEANTETDR